MVQLLLLVPGHENARGRLIALPWITGPFRLYRYSLMLVMRGVVIAGLHVGHDLNLVVQE